MQTIVEENILAVVLKSKVEKVNYYYNVTNTKKTTEPRFSTRGSKLPRRGPELVVAVVGRVANIIQC